MQSQHPDMLAQQKQPLVTTPPAQQPSPTMFSPPAATPPTMGQQPPPPGMLVDPAQANSIDNAGLADRTFARQRGIAGIESGGAKNPYALLGSVTGSGDRAYGKYQVMGNNIPSWTQAALGQSMTPQQFLANPQAQDAVFNHRFGQYADKYGEQGAAKAWYAGERGMQNPNATDMHGRLTVAGYGQDFARRAGTPDPRAAATAALVAQQQPPAGLPPEITGGASQPDQRLAFNGAQPPAPAGIRAAPPAAPPIQSAPPPQAGQPQTTKPGYVLTVPPEPTPPPTMTEGMARIQQKIWSTPPSQREGVQQALQPLYDQEVAKLAQQKAVYDEKMKNLHEMKKLKEEQEASAQGRVDTHLKEQEAITKARDENKLRAQFANMPPDEVFKKVNESHKIAKSGADALTASAAAMDAFSKGAITGYGADAKLNVAKLFTAMGLVDKGDRIANTETFRNAMAPVVAAIMHQTSGTSQLSEGELAFAKQAAAGNISLDAQSIQQLVSIIDKRSHEVLKDHQTLTGTLFGEDPKAKALYGVETPNVPRNFASEADAAAAGLKPGTRVRINGRVGRIE